MQHPLYPCICRWKFSLFPCLGYCKLCCYEHKGAWIFSMYSFIPDICSGLNLLDHMETLFLLFLRNFHIFCHSGWTSLYSAKSVRGSPSSHPSPDSLIRQLFNDGHSDWYEVVPHRNVSGLSLLVSNAEHLFICLLAICESSFKPKISVVRVMSLVLSKMNNTSANVSWMCSECSLTLLVMGQSDEIFRKGIVILFGNTADQWDGKVTPQRIILPELDGLFGGWRGLVSIYWM